MHVKNQSNFKFLSSYRKYLIGHIKLIVLCISIIDPVCISVLKRNTVSIVNTSLSFKKLYKKC